MAEQKETYSGDPEIRLQELAETEARIRQEIYERQQALANINARKLKIQQTLVRSSEPQKEPTLAEAMQNHDRQVDQNQLPPPRRMVQGPNGLEPQPIGPSDWMDQTVAPLQQPRAPIRQPPMGQGSSVAPPANVTGLSPQEMAMFESFLRRY